MINIMRGSEGTIFFQPTPSYKFNGISLTHIEKSIGLSGTLSGNVRHTIDQSGSIIADCTNNVTWYYPD